MHKVALYKTLLLRVVSEVPLLGAQAMFIQLGMPVPVRLGWCWDCYVDGAGETTRFAEDTLRTHCRPYWLQNDTEFIGPQGGPVVTVTQISYNNNRSQVVYEPKIAGVGSIAARWTGSGHQGAHIQKAWKR